MSTDRPAMRIESADATYKSLVALLRSPASSAVDHLRLIGSTSVSASITHYLATLPTDEAAEFAQILVTSNAFWSTTGDTTHSTAKRQDEADQVILHDQFSSDTLLARSLLLFEATARAVLGRIQVIVHQNKGIVGWSVQRSFVSWIRALSDAVVVDQASIPRACDSIPVSSLALRTGLVAGLQAARAQKKEMQAKANQGNTDSSNTLSTRYALRRAEEEWCVLLTECVGLLDERNAQQEQEVEKEQQTGQDSEEDAWEKEFRKASLSVTAGKAATSSSLQADVLKNDAQIVTLVLAAQVSPYVKATRIAVVPSDLLINVLSRSVLGLFEQSNTIQSIREDVSQDGQGLLVIHSTSSTIQRATIIAAHPLFGVLGPLSRLMSLAFSGIATSQSPLQAQDILLTSPNAPMKRMADLAAQWQAKWFGCRLAGAKESEIAKSSQEHTKLLWNVFKTLLFSYTMIFDALMEAIVDVCPTPTETRPLTPADTANQTTDGQAADLSKWQALTVSNIPPSYLDIVRSVLVTYSRLSWITATFGSSAFDAYRRVFYEALEVLARDGLASVALTKDLMPASLTAFESNAARRAEAVYFLDIVEQLMVQLPNELVEDVVLPACRPYLDDRTHQVAFESAHSVILSVYTSDKDCLLELTPYYIRLLLKSFPAHLSAEQLTLGFSTVIDAVSDRSDTMAWYALEQLWNESEKERLQAFHGNNDGPARALSGQLLGQQQSANEPGDVEKARQQRQRDLSDVYVAQVQNVNLVLLRSTLRHVKQLIMRLPRGSEERLHLCQKTFASLAGLDASTREEGVRWWLDQREAFGV